MDVFLKIYNVKVPRSHPGMGRRHRWRHPFLFQSTICSHTFKVAVAICCAQIPHFYTQKIDKYICVRCYLSNSCIFSFVCQ